MNSKRNKLRPMWCRGRELRCPATAGLGLGSLFLLLFLAPNSVLAAVAEGFLDKADQTMIAGWARDPDYSGPIHVHVYVNGQFTRDELANGYRSDIGNHSWGWLDPGLPLGQHEVRVYAIGVNSSGQPDGQNPELGNSPKTYGQPVSDQYRVNSTDSQVEVVFDSRFGGAIRAGNETTWDRVDFCSLCSCQGQSRKTFQNLTGQDW